MTRFKAYVKPCNEGMNKIFSRGSQLEIGCKFEIVDSARIQVEIEDLIGICNQGLEFDCVDEGFP
jgi:hypothetical protein